MYTTDITEYRETNREDVLLELVTQRTSLVNWLSGAAINDNNINGSITKYNMMKEEVKQIDNLIEQLLK